MRVLMFGWEFPPLSYGGLGVACYGLTKALAKKGIDITFVLPALPDEGNKIKSHVKLIGANRFSKIKVLTIETLIRPYETDQSYRILVQSLKRKMDTSLYGRNLYEEVQRYAEVAKLIAKNEKFDVIHAHDWLTYLAGINAKRVSGKKLVVHVHATEFDRTGGNPNPFVYDIEYRGFHEADLIFTVSNYTKRIVVEKYNVPEEKVWVVHNGIEPYEEQVKVNKILPKVVLFLGRITLQKGPEYFIYAAKKVLDYDPNVFFVVAGSGDMLPRIINLAAELGISKNVLFTGYLRGRKIREAYAMADVFVMPSVSEPFGLTPLEAILNGTPVIISKQSGVSEVLHHALKVDFWDVDELANKILALLKYKPLKQELMKNAINNVYRITWDDAAKKVVDGYNYVLNH